MNNNYRPNEIDIESILISNFEGKFQEITNLLSGFEIFESLFDNTMSAKLYITNSVAIIEKFPIVGEEFVVMRFSTPGEKKREYVFYLDSIKKRIIRNDRSEGLQLNLVSVEELSTRFSSVDRSFESKSIKDIVNQVYVSYVRNGVKYPTGNSTATKKKKIEIEDTLGTHSFVSTYSPFDFINYCAVQAESPLYRESDFIFFENYKGFHFKTISALSRTDVVDSFYYGFNTSIDISNRGEVKQYQVASSMTISSSVDTVNNADLGLFANEVSFFDPITKTYRTSNFNYYRDYDQKAEPLGSSKIISRNSFLSIEQPSNPCTHYIHGSDLEAYEKLDYVKNNDNKLIQNGFRRQRFLNRLITKAALTNNTINISITIPGNTELVAGDTINLFVPEASQDKESLRRFNYFFGKESPKFMITNVNHYYRENEFYTILSCVKAGFGRNIKSRNG